MLVRKLFSVYCGEETGGAGAGAGGGSSGSEENSTAGKSSEDFEAKIKVAVDAATAGLVTKNKELLDELKDTRTKFKGIDADRARQLLDKFESDEDADLIAKGKIDDFLSKKYAKRDEAWKQKLDAETAKTQAAEAKTQKFLNRVLDDRLREAFNGKVDPRSMKAALLEAKQIFVLDDEGLAIQRGPDGVVVLGKDGKTPFSPQEWIDSDAVRKESPYLFPATGSGAGTGQSNSGGLKSVGDISKLSPAQKMAAGRQLKN